MEPGRPEHRSDAHARYHLDGRIERGVPDDAAVVGVAVALVDVVELDGARRLTGISLHERHAVHLLVEIGVHARGLGAHLAEGIANAPAGVVHPERDRRETGKGDERRLPVEREHHRDDEREADEIAEGVERARAEDLADRIDVVGDPRHEPADGRAIEELEAPRVEEAEDRLAQIAHGARTGHLQQIHLREGDRLLEDDHTGEHEARMRDGVRIGLRRVEPVSHDERAREGEETSSPPGAASTPRGPISAGSRRARGASGSSSRKR